MIYAYSSHRSAPTVGHVTLSMGNMNGNFIFGPAASEAAAISLTALNP